MGSVERVSEAIANGRQRVRSVGSRRIVLLIVTLGAVLRFAFIGSEDLWLDETMSLFLVSNESLLEIAFELPQSDPHPPLYFLVFKAWIGVFGTGEVSVRALSAVLGVAALPFIYGTARELFDRKTATISTFLAAISPFYIYYAQEARMYSMLMLFTASSFYFFLKFGRSGNFRDAGLYIVATVLLGYTHVHGAFIILAQNVIVFSYLRREHRPDFLPGIVSWIKTQAIAAVLLSPVVVWVVLRALGGGSPTWLIPPTPRWFFGTFYLWTVNRTYPRLWYTLLWLVVLFGIVGLHSVVNLRDLLRRFGRDDGSLPVSIRRGDRHSLYLVVIWLVVPVVVPIVVSYVVSPIYHPKYTITASIAFYLLIGYSLRSVSDPLLQFVAIVLVVSTLVAPLVPYYAEQQKENWSSVTDDIERQADAGDVVLITDHFVKVPFFYYSNSTEAEVVPVREDISNRSLHRITRDENTVYLVVSHADSTEVNQMRSVLTRSRTLLEHREYPGVEVYVFGNETDRSARISNIGRPGYWENDRVENIATARPSNSWAGTNII